MANIKKRVLKELKIQEKEEGLTENIKALKKVINILKTVREFNILINIRCHKYGVLSYQYHRFYYLSDTLKLLIQLK